jgi:hypothetical protein
VVLDLQRLGFIPESAAPETLQQMAGPIGRILAQLSGESPAGCSCLQLSPLGPAALGSAPAGCCSQPCL